MTRRRVYLALLAIVAVGAGLRIAWNDVAEFSQADETVYHISARILSNDPTRYPEMVRAYLNDPGRQLFPMPSRWGGLVITSAACAVAPCSLRTLAWVETLAGIAAIAVTFFATRRLFGDAAGLIAAAFTVTSPIQLAMGRRALEDELLLLAVLLAVWATIALAQSPRPTWRLVAAALGAYTLAFSLKETFLLFYPALAALLLIVRRDWRPRPGDVVAFAFAPVLFAAVFGLLSREPLALVSLARLQLSMAGNPYIASFQSGPFYVPLLHTLILAPVVSVIALFAAGIALRDRTDRHALALCAFVALLFVAFAIMPKDARYSMAADAGFRMLTAWGVTNAGLFGRALVPPFALVALNAAVEIPLFIAVFVRGGVYDPNLVDLLRALGAIPR